MILITREPTGDIRPVEEKLESIKVYKKVTGGGIGEKLCQIALGVSDANINTNFRVSKWDTAAVQVILEEAGGIILTTMEILLITNMLNHDYQGVSLLQQTKNSIQKL